MSASGIAYITYDKDHCIVTVDVAAAVMVRNPRVPFPDSFTGACRGTSADGTKIALATGVSVRVLDGLTGAQLGEASKGTMWGAKWSPDGTMLAAAFDSGAKMAIWNFVPPATLGEITALPVPPGSGNGMNVAWSPDSKKVMLAMWSNTPPYALLDVPTKTLVPLTLSGITGHVWSVSWSATGHVAFLTSNGLRVYRADTWALIHSETNPPGGGSGGDCAYSPDGAKLLVTHGVGGSKRLFAVSGHSYSAVALTGQIPTGDPFAVGMSPDNLYGVVTYRGGNYMVSVVTLASGVCRYVSGSDVKGTTYGTVPQTSGAYVARNVAVQASGVQRMVSNESAGPVRGKDGNPAQRDVALVTRGPVMEVGRGRSDASGFYMANANFVGDEPIAAVFFGADDSEGSVIVDWIP